MKLLLTLTLIIIEVVLSSRIDQNFKISQQAACYKLIIEIKSITFRFNFNGMDGMESFNQDQFHHLG